MKYVGWTGGLRDDYGYDKVDKGLKARIKVETYLAIVRHWKRRLMEHSVFAADNLFNPHNVRWFADKIGDKWPKLVSKAALEEDFKITVPEWGHTVDRSILLQVLKPFIYYDESQGGRVSMWNHKKLESGSTRSAFMMLPSHASCWVHWEMKTEEPLSERKGTVAIPDFLDAVRFQIEESSRFRVRQQIGFFNPKRDCGDVPHGIDESGVL